MLSKIFLFLINFLFLLPFKGLAASGEITEPITCFLKIQMVELNEDIPLSLTMKKGHPYAFVNVLVTVNNVVEINQDVVTKYLETTPFKIKGFSNANETKSLKVQVKYLETTVQESYCNLLIYPPHREVYKTADVDSKRFKEPHYSMYTVNFKGGNASKFKNYEFVTLKGKYAYTLDNARIIDFNPFSITLSNILMDNIACELRLYTSFKGSDLLYKNGYTSIDMTLVNRGNGKYAIKNEYRFYISKKDGMIFENYNSDCEDELLPFFIPLSYHKNKIPFEIYFLDIGLNHNDYVFAGNFILSPIDDTPSYGKVLNYKYVEKEPLENVTYA